MLGPNLSLKYRSCGGCRADCARAAPPLRANPRANAIIDLFMPVAPSVRSFLPGHSRAPHHSRRSEPADRAHDTTAAPLAQEPGPILSATLWGAARSRGLPPAGHA